MNQTKWLSTAKQQLLYTIYFRTVESAAYCPPGFIDGENGAGNVIDGVWRTEHDPCSGLVPLRHAGSKMLILHLYNYNNRYSRPAALVRDSYRAYFNSS